MPSRASNAVLTVDSSADRDIGISSEQSGELGGELRGFFGIWRRRVKACALVPAKAGPILRGGYVEARWSTPSFNNRRPGLWVPAFAGTTGGEIYAFPPSPCKN